MLHAILHLAHRTLSQAWRQWREFALAAAHAEERKRATVQRVFGVLHLWETARAWHQCDMPYPIEAAACNVRGHDVRVMRRRSAFVCSRSSTL